MLKEYFSSGSWVFHSGLVLFCLLLTSFLMLEYRMVTTIRPGDLCIRPVNGSSWVCVRGLYKQFV